MKSFTVGAMNTLLLYWSKTASACSICFFGDPTSRANVALRWGIITLLIVLVVVLALMVSFFLSVARRDGLSQES
jgi:hypothetical protein